ncbi:MAG: amidohydrolase family protein [Hyphomicrobiales bacterium]|nr:amidohydrolase family protein [Hyphomicrobiales bacterium]
MNFTVSHILRAPGFDPEGGPFKVSVEGARVDKVGKAGQADPSLMLPALVNAHDHGYGIPTLAVGACDDALECWIPGLANRPDTDPQLEAMVAFGRMALAGIGTTVHCHNSLRRDRLPAEAEAVARAAGAVGIRVAFSCPIADRNPIVYGDAKRILDYGYPEERLGAGRSPIDGKQQVKNALEIRQALRSDIFNVQFGPIGPQWCTDETLEEIADRSAATGMRVHMHLLETERQRQWLDATYGQDPVGWLDRIGLLSPRLTVAHGVWLRSDECDLLAERGVTVAVNTSSNLRLRSGIAPVSVYRQSDLAFGIGLDGAAFDDDQDMFREIRLIKRLQSGMSLNDEMPPATVFHASLEHGFRVFNGDRDYGAIESGARADLLVLDVAPLVEDSLVGDALVADLVFARSSAANVETLVVAGQMVVRDGMLTGFDFEAAESELVTSARQSETGNRSGPDDIRQAREAIRRFYFAKHHCG